jgi:cell fate regulator YaaT (PSP1 superfamily)
MRTFRLWKFNVLLYSSEKKLWEMEGKTEKTNQYKDKDIIAGRGCCVADTVTASAVSNQSACCKLSSFNWLAGVEDPVQSENEERFVEVRFKNDRKDFFLCPPELTLKENDIVTVEASPGHDVGIVSLTGELVRLQMKRKNYVPERAGIKKVYRRARAADIEKWLAAVDREKDTLYGTRRIAGELGLEMKVNDVEYQGDKTKAIFYFTAADRVDFRQLIRRLADAFKVRVEMRQIGMRQEAAKLGGIGSCGRELCCSSFMSSFKSVSTSSARVQQLSLNPQKLAGQCGKLKCCLNYELDTYIEALREFPDSKTVLQTKKGPAYHQKSDVFQKLMWFAYADDPNNMMALPVEKVKKVIQMNRKNKFPAELEAFALQVEQKTEEDTENADNFVDYI